MTYRSLLWALCAVAVGCADEDPGYLRVQGAAVVVLEDGTETAFEFERLARVEGRLAGHCLVGPSEEAPVTLSVGIERTVVEADDGGLRSLVIRMDGAATGEVQVEVGTAVFAAESGEACSLARPYVEGAEGLAAVMADCTLVGPDARTAHVAADLEFVGCRPE